MHTILKIANAALSPIDAVFRWSIASALLLMTSVLFVNVVGRTMFNFSFIGAPTLGRLLMIWLTFIGSYVVVRSAEHIAVDMLSNFLSRRVQRVLGVIANGTAMVLSAYIAWLGYLYTATRFAVGQMDVMLQIPTGYFFLPIPIGFSLMAVGFLIKAMSILVDEPMKSNGSITPETGNN